LDYQNNTVAVLTTYPITNGEIWPNSRELNVCLSCCHTLKICNLQIYGRIKSTVYTLDKSLWVICEPKKAQILPASTSYFPVTIRVRVVAWSRDEPSFRLGLGGFALGFAVRLIKTHYHKHKVEQGTF